jgi:hypothetical protein
VSEIEDILRDYAAKLATIGSADAIALRLQGYDIKAECGSWHRCALAVDIQRVLHEHGITDANIAVGSLIHHSRPGSTRGNPIQLTDAAWDFIRRFDCGEYPELIL